MMNATDAQRMAAMMEAFNKSMSGESTKAMASSLTGSLQGLQDTIFNPSVGILGMSVTFSKEEQKKANEAIRRIQNERIAGYTRELKSTKTSEERKKQLRINIEQAETTRDQLIKDDVISTPFKAFSYAFSNIVRKLTEALNAIGPVWTNFAVAAIDVTNKVFGPLGETLGNVASDMRAKKVTQAEGFGRIVGEIFKTTGQIMGDLANMINDPNSAMGKVQSEFMKGFMAAFKAPGTLQAAQEGIKNGLSALIGKFFEFLWKAITFEPVRPLMLLFVAGIFGPPLIGAVIAGATPLIISAIGKMVVGSLGRGAAPRVAGGGFLSGLKPSPKLGVAAKGWWQTAYTKPIGPAQAGSYEAMRGPGYMASKLTGAAKTQGALSGIAKIGQKIPGLALAFAGLDFTLRKAAGQKTSVAAGGAAGNLVGGLAGAAIGQALIPIPGVGAVAGGVVGSFLGSWIGENIAPVFDNLPKRLEAGWSATKSWFTTLPETLGGWLGATAVKIKNWFQNELPFIWMKFKSDMGNGITTFKDWVGKKLSDPATYTSLGQNLLNGLKSGLALLDIGGIIVDFIRRGAEAAKTGATVEAATGSPKEGDRKFTPGVGSFTYRKGNWVKNAVQGNLGDAISSEIRNKPSGSNLVIANSSETIIPAAGGLGMQDFMGVLTSGFNSLGALFKKSEEKSDKNQNDNKDRFTKLDEKLAKLSTGGSMFGMGGPGHIVGVGKALLGMGLQVGMNPFFQYGRGFLPGGGGYIGRHAAGSYHYAGRALDVSGPPGLLDAAYARLRGTNPAELLWRVPGHYDHLHVAYALGAGMPAFFSTQRDAMDWERRATLGNAKVSSITSNSSEGMGGGVTVNAPITIHQQPGQNSEQLASLVAMELANAVRQARSSSMYV
jgi:hypothetical protein